MQKPNGPHGPIDLTDVLRAEPGPDIQRIGKEMTDRMLWGIARGVSEKDTATLTALRDMNRAERRRYLARNGKRVRKP